MVEGSNYLDNLELMDRSLGEVRRSMEDMGTWETATVLVTSDHWWKTGVQESSSQPLSTSEEAAFADRIGHRVPFLLKMAGQKEAMTYESAFNTVLTHDLLLALLRGKVCTPNSVVSWIDQQRSIAGNPHTASGKPVPAAGRRLILSSRFLRALQCYTVHPASPFPWPSPNASSASALRSLT